MEKPRMLSANSRFYRFDEVIVDIALENIYGGVL